MPIQATKALTTYNPLPSIQKSYRQVKVREGALNKSGQMITRPKKLEQKYEVCPTCYRN